MRVRFEVPGEPRGKKRPQFGGGHAYTPKQTVEYENWVKLCFLEQCKDVYFEKGIALGMDVMAYFGIPKSVSQKKSRMMVSGEIRPTKPYDSSNILKAVEDGLNKVAYYDDAQIVDTKISRYYGERPRVEVSIWGINDEVGYEDPE